MSFLRRLAAGGPACLDPGGWPAPPADEAEILEMVLDSVRRFRDEGLDGARHDRESALAPGVLDGLRELGLFGLIFPEEYGGLGLGMRAYVHVFECLSWECVSTPTLLGGHLSLCGRGLLLYGTEEQKARWLPAMAAGERIGAFALSEAGAGSDFRSLATRAVREEGGWRLHGTKLWITNGREAGLFLVFARIEAAEGNLGAFLVPREAEGLGVGRPEEKMGLHASSTTPLELDGVFVPEADLLGRPGQGFEIAVRILNRGRAGWSGACLGASARALHEALEHARQRVQYGQPILRFGMIREYLAAMAAELASVRALAELVAGWTDAGEEDLVLESAALKILATEVNGRIADLALQIAGGNGFSREYPYERILRDARVSRIFEGTNEVLRMLLARQFAAAVPEDPGPAPAAAEGPGERLEQDAARLRRLTASARRLHGEAFRFAEHDHRRIADGLLHLAARAALLARRHAEPAAEAPAVVDHALALHERAFEAVVQEAEEPLDASAEAAAAALEAGGA